MCGVAKLASDRKILDKGTPGGREMRIFEIPVPHRTIQVGALKKILWVHCIRSSAMPRVNMELTLSFTSVSLCYKT